MSLKVKVRCEEADAGTHHFPKTDPKTGTRAVVKNADGSETPQNDEFPIVSLKFVPVKDQPDLWPRLPEWAQIHLHQIVPPASPFVVGQEYTLTIE